MPERTTIHKEYIIEAKNVCKLYGAGKQEAARMLANGATKDQVYRETGVTAALWDVNLNIRRGEIFVIIGLSGSGKSTLVRCFNKLNRVTSGEILFNGVNIDSLSQQELLKLRREKISMVFQSFGLMSHRNVLQNVAYGLEVRGEPKETREKAANEIISMVGLDGMQQKSCAQLSGGMQQRVGIARALANSPEVLLMDEPFSALDPLVRRDLQFELLSIQRSLEKTVVFITHDIDEAFRLGDTVAIMQDGRLIQMDTPEKMSANPKTEYVRQFIESANKTKVLTAKNVMVTPSSIMRTTDTVDMALNEMRKTGLSSVYTCDDKLRLIGIVTLSDAIRGRQTGLELFQIINRAVVTVSPETLLADIIPQATDTPFPVAVTDEQGRLLGLVTKAALLTSVI